MYSLPVSKPLCDDCVPHFSNAVHTWAVMVLSGGFFNFSWSPNLGKSFNHVKQEGMNSWKAILVDRILSVQKPDCVQTLSTDF